ncbi:hypothetical protein GCM10027601_14030 [Nocardioides ungokensis]
MLWRDMACNGLSTSPAQAIAQAKRPILRCVSGDSSMGFLPVRGSPDGHLPPTLGSPGPGVVSPGVGPRQPVV